MGFTSPVGRGNFGGRGAHCKVWGHSVVTCVKTAEPIVMLFALSARSGSRNHELDGGPDCPQKGAILGERVAHCEVYRLSAMSCTEMAELIDLPFRLWTRVGWRKHKFNCICQVAPMFPPIWAHWHHLANTTTGKPSVCGGDAVLCQITFTTCCCYSTFAYPHELLIQSKTFVLLHLQFCVREEHCPLGAHSFALVLYFCHCLCASRCRRVRLSVRSLWVHPGIAMQLTSRHLCVCLRTHGWQRYSSCRKKNKAKWQTEDKINLQCYRLQYYRTKFSQIFNGKIDRLMTVYSKHEPIQIC